MKKTTTILGIICLAFTANAQILKGTLYGLLDLSFYNSKSDYSKVNGSTSTATAEYSYTNFNIGPGVQYFFKNNLSVGLGVGFDKSTNKTNDISGKKTTKYSYTGTSLSLGLYKYFDASEKLKTFLGFSIGMSPQKGTIDETNTQTSVTTTSKTESQNTAVNLTGGVAWLATKRIMLLTNIGLMGYNWNTNKYNITSTGYAKSKGSYFQFYLNSNNFYYSISFAYKLFGPKSN